MANKHRGEVSIELDKMRTFRFTHWALAEIEDALGCDIDKIDEAPTMKVLIAMVRGALLHELPELTLQETAELMDHGDTEEIGSKVEEAFQLAFGSKKEKKKKGSHGAGKK